MFALWLVFVMSVTDGDTFRGRVQLWHGQTLETAIRIVGIDTPEIRGKCAREKQLALKAQEALTILLKGHTVFLSHIKPDKFGGRYLATVQTSEGMNIGQELIKQDFAVSYNGQGAKHNWCS